MVKKDKYYLTGILLILGICVMVVYILYYIPYNAEMQNIKNAIKDNEQKLRILKTFAAEREKDENFINKMAMDNLYWENKLPEQNDETVFISFLQEVAKNSGTEISSIEPNFPLAKSSTYEEIIIKIKIEGNYFQLLDFLTQLNEAQRYNIVDKININSQNNLLKADMAIKIFSLHE